MADNVTIPATGTGDATPIVATDKIGGVDYQRVKITTGADGTANDVSTANPVPVSDAGGSLTVDGAVTVSGTVTASGPLTDTQLRATAVPVSGTVTASGPLTDTQLRATAVPVSGTVTATTGGLTDTQLRATAVPISGTVTTSGVADMTAAGGLTTSGQAVSLTGMNGMSVCQVQLTGSVAGLSIGLEAQVDGSNWFGVPHGAVITDASDSITSSTTFGAIGNYIVPCAGYSGIRVRIIAGSGSLGVTLRASAGATLTTLASMLPAGTNTIGGVTLIDTGGSNVGVIDANGALSVKEKKAATPTLSNVAGSASSVTVLAANSARLGAMITNDSTAILYLKFGTTASTTSHTVQLLGSTSTFIAYYEVPFGYTGRIDGIWASATGNARVTELAA